VSKTQLVQIISDKHFLQKATAKGLCKARGSREHASNRSKAEPDHQTVFSEFYIENTVFGENSREMLSMNKTTFLSFFSISMKAMNLRPHTQCVEI